MDITLALDLGTLAMAGSADKRDFQRCDIGIFIFDRKNRVVAVAILTAWGQGIALGQGLAM